MQARSAAGSFCRMAPCRRQAASYGTTAAAPVRRGGDPEAREFNWRRVVDFCSGVFLVVPRKLFASLGGFDEAFAPAYYEEVDFAVRLREIGKYMVYDPRAVVFHHEYGSSTAAALRTSCGAISLCFGSVTRSISRGQRASEAAGDLYRPGLPHPATSVSSTSRMTCRSAPPVQACRVPGRSSASFRGLGLKSAFVALQNWARAMRGAYEFLPLDVELADLSNRSLEDFLVSRRGYFARIFVSRPHNMAALAEVREDGPNSSRALS